MSKKQGQYNYILSGFVLGIIVALCAFVYSAYRKETMESVGVEYEYFMDDFDYIERRDLKSQQDADEQDEIAHVELDESEQERNDVLQEEDDFIEDEIPGVGGAEEVREELPKKNNANSKEREELPKKKQFELKNRSFKKQEESPRVNAQEFIIIEEFSYELTRDARGPRLRTSPDALIEISRKHDFSSIYLRTRTDATGSFVIANPPPGVFYWRKVESPSRVYKINVVIP